MVADRVQIAWYGGKPVDHAAWEEIIRGALSTAEVGTVEIVEAGAGWRVESARMTRPGAASIANGPGQRECRLELTRALATAGKRVMP